MDRIVLSKLDNDVIRACVELQTSVTIHHVDIENVIRSLEEINKIKTVENKDIVIGLLRNLDKRYNYIHLKESIWCYLYSGIPFDKTIHFKHLSDKREFDLYFYHSLLHEYDSRKRTLKTFKERIVKCRNELMDIESSMYSISAIKYDGVRIENKSYNNDRLYYQMDRKHELEYQLVMYESLVKELNKDLDKYKQIKDFQKNAKKKRITEHLINEQTIELIYNLFNLQINIAPMF